MNDTSQKFTFEISLSVLNHLGRNLYRSFMTVIGEAISNAWDADAENVWIWVNKDNNSFIIRDDGMGMDAEDFQTKFLKIGYSKRKDSSSSPEKKRPLIGRKGIGKLALLSCSERIHIISKKIGSGIVGGVIDNSGLDTAINDDLSTTDYQLEKIEEQIFGTYLNEIEHGTVIYFENMKQGIRMRTDHLKQLIALYFRFSLRDANFTMFVDGEKIGFDQLEELVKDTQFLWEFEGTGDPFISDFLKVSEALLESKSFKLDGIEGFIASVKKPSDLKIFSTDEKVSIDLFVNGRLRERDLLKHIPKARIVENYLYGQIHFDQLDSSDVDRFASSREGIIADDPLFNDLLAALSNVIDQIIYDWDVWRLKHKQNGDSDNSRIPRRERKSKELFNVVSEDFSLPVDAPNKSKVDEWVSELEPDASFNFPSYAECFIAENLLRKLISDKKIELSPEAIRESEDKKRKESDAKVNGALSIQIRQSEDNVYYLSMKDLAYLLDNTKNAKGPSLPKDADKYKPIRDALMHTSLLTTPAKTTLTAAYENIKSRLRTLLSSL